MTNTCETMEGVEQESEPPLPAAEPKTTIFLDNMSEDVWPFIAALDDESARQSEVNENVALTDRQYLGVRAEFPKDLLFIAPAPIEPVFVHYVDALVDGAEPRVMVPAHHTGQLSEDILHDPDLCAHIGSLTSHIQLTSYCSSRSLYRLLDHFTSIYPSLSPSLPESPEAACWDQTVGVFGTKGGLRRALEQNPVEGINMAPGRVVEGKTAIVTEAITRIQQCGGVVIKTNKGHAGMGVIILKPEDIPTDPTVWESFIHQRLEASNGYWELFPAIVEAYIPPLSTIGGGFPNVECQVHANGEVEVLFVCGMRVKRGVFAGVEIMHRVLPASFEERVREIGIQLGRRYAAAGYRGYFDVDFIVNEAGELFVCESNVRRTGGTWAYRVARRLFGESYLDNHYYVTNIRCFSNQRLYEFDAMLKQLKPVLYSADNPDRGGAIVASARLLTQGKLNYMVIAKTKAEAALIEGKIKSLLDE